MSDDLATDLVNTGTDAADVEFDKQIKKGANIEDAVTKSLEVGATVAGTAACAATGVGAIAAPLCGFVAAKLVGPIIELGKAFVNWIGDLFSSEPPPPILIDYKSLCEQVKCDKAYKDTWARIDVYIEHAQHVDYLLATQLEQAQNTVGRAIQDLDQIPDSDGIEAQFASAGLQLVDYGPDYYRSPFVTTFLIPVDMRDDPNVISKTWRGRYTPPSFKDKLDALWHSVSRGELSPAQFFTAGDRVFEESVEWSKKLTVEAARIMMLVAVGSLIRSGMTSTANDDVRQTPKPHEPTAAQRRAINNAIATRSPAFMLYYGIVDGIQFIRRN